MQDDLVSSVATAIDAEIYRQYKAMTEIEEPVNVLDCLDYCLIATASIDALLKAYARQGSPQ